MALGHIIWRIPDIRDARAGCCDAEAHTYAGRTTKQGVTAMPFYTKGDVRIHYEEVGSGFPLLVTPGGV
jgi:hypothetical protein